MKFGRTFLFLLATVFAVLGLIGCGPQSESSDAGAGVHADGPYRVACTVGMIADVVRHIAGECRCSIL
jgi:ABC-type Zn uptake system ZnuABC Zn-binding protein ZnuA